MVGRHLFGKASWQVLVLGSVFGFIKDQYMLPSLQTFAEIASHLEESFFFSSWKIYSNMFWQIRDSHPMPPIFSESNLLNVAGDFEGSLRRCSIFTVGTLGVRIFFGKNWGFVVLRLFFLHAVFLFLSFFWGETEGDQWNWNIFWKKKSEVNHTEIFHAKNAGKPYRAAL